MDSKDQNLDLIRTKRIHFCLFQSTFICWVKQRERHPQFTDGTLGLYIVGTQPACCYLLSLPPRGRGL